MTKKTLIIACLACCAAVPAAAGQDRRLPLSLSAGQEFDFKVQMNKDLAALPPPRADVPIEVRTKEKPPEPEAGTATITERYLLRVRDAVSGGDATFELAVRGEAPAVGVKPLRFACSAHPEIVSDAPGMCRICGLQLVLSATGGTKAEFTVVVDSRGAIKSLAGTSQPPAVPGGGPADDPARPAAALAAPEEAEVRNVLQAIFAAGLHDVDLEPGRVYILESAAAPPAAGAGSGSGVAWHPVHLRFEEVSSAGAERVARFTVTSPEEAKPSAGVEPAGEAAATEPRGARGQATYCYADGLLQDLTIAHGPAGGARPQDGSKPAWVTVNRMPKSDSK